MGQCSGATAERGRALHVYWRLAVCLVLLAVSTCQLSAQNTEVEARAASVTGHVRLSTGSGIPAFELTTGYVLNPGDQVDTRAGGRVVIDLSDGSVVVVQPGSIVIIKDYRSAGSARELFEILLGRVRVKINHLGGRPNPYRMNSPTASIAVRGTEFGITVDSRGSTQVVVFEGAVQVTSLTNADDTVLIEGGRAVLVEAGQDFHLFTPAGDRDFGDHAETHANDNHASSSRPQPQSSPGASSALRPDNDESPRSLAGTYGQYIAGLSEIGQLPFLLRFNAFPESHLDSLENPAYATTFTQAEGRLFLLPSLSGIQGVEQDTSFGPLAKQSATYAISPQVTLFAPVAGTPIVIGGSMTASRVAGGVPGSSPDYDPGVLGQMTNFHSLLSSGSSTSTFYSGSALASTRLGISSRTSLGVEIESLKGHGSLASTTVDSDIAAQPSSETINARSDISQTRITAGFTRDLFESQKLGMFYRYALIGANDSDITHVLNGTPQALNGARSSGHSSEAGLRWRGSITRRLFYGMEAGWVGLTLEDGLKRSRAIASHQRDHANRGTLGLGLGYALGRRTLLSFDVSGALSRNTANQTADQGGLLLQTGAASSHFVSLHGAIQTNVTKRLFVSASLLSVWQDHDMRYTVLPDAYGNLAPLSTAFFPLTPTRYQVKGHYSDYGVGWRFSTELFAQYLYSTDYGFSTPSHTLMLRYTFHLHND